MAAGFEIGDRVVITGGAYAGRFATIARLTTANDDSPMAWVRRDGDSSDHLYPVDLLRPTVSPVGVGDRVVDVSTGTYAGQIGVIVAIDTTDAEPMAKVALEDCTGDRPLPVRDLRPAKQDPPIAASRIWSAVMDRADYRCQCPAKHHKAHRGGRCHAGAGEDLITGPSVPGPNPDRAAAVVPADELLAWCPPCWDETVRDARRQARAAERTARRTGELAGALW